MGGSWDSGLVWLWTSHWTGITADCKGSARSVPCCVPQTPTSHLQGPSTQGGAGQLWPQVTLSPWAAAGWGLSRSTHCSAGHRAVPRGWAFEPGHPPQPRTILASPGITSVESLPYNPEAILADNLRIGCSAYFAQKRLGVFRIP